MLRIGGFGAIAGGALWFAGLAASSLLGGDRVWMALMGLGTLGLLVALIGLSAFQAYRDAALAWAAFAIPAIGSLASLVGIAVMALSPSEDPLVLGSISAWSVAMVGLLGMLIGSILFAAVTIRAAVLSRRAAQALAISSAVVLLVAFGSFGSDMGTVGTIVITASVGSFAASWIALGIMALRRGPIRAIAPG